ncbi:MAG: hypothetical protein WCG25_05785 [bacterium]
MENQNPDPKPIEQPKEKWSFKKWLSSFRKKEEAPENENTDKNPEQKGKFPWLWVLIVLIIIAIVACFLIFKPFSSKEEKDKAKTEQTTQPTQPGATQPTQPGGTQPTQPGGTQPTQPGATQPTQPGGTQPTQPGGTQPTQPSVQNGLQITFNYSQTFEWSSLDPKEQKRLQNLEVETNKIAIPINVNLKDIMELGKKRVTNYQNKGYDMVQLQYLENGNVKTIFTRQGNITIAL